MSGASVIYRLTPGGALNGRLRVPGDKSISHRAVMFGAIAEGVTDISGFLEGEDALATMNAFRAMGVGIEGPDNGRVRVHGVGLQGLRSPEGPIDCGNSGTSMRLLMGLLAGQGVEATLVGDESLMRRPMERVAEPLRRMGARVTTSDGRPPVVIRPMRELKSIHYRLPVASAQVKSAILLAGLSSEAVVEVVEPAVTRDHTERMLRAMGADVASTTSVVLRVGPELKLAGRPIVVPGDISSAAFFLVGASIAPGSDLLLEGVGVNPTRTGVIDILRRMGADIELTNERDEGGEPVADLRVRHAPLSGIVIPPELVPLAIDEFPALFVAAALAQGETVLTGAEELRVKESDRIQVMADGLAALGADVTPLPDGMRIRGGQLGGGRVHARGDHRIAMAFAMAALAAEGEIIIDDCANVATSFPGFPELAGVAGLRLEVQRP